MIIEIIKLKITPSRVAFLSPNSLTLLPYTTAETEMIASTIKANFKKKPCIPKSNPSTETPVFLPICVDISLSIAGGKMKAAPLIPAPIIAQNTKIVIIFDELKIIIPSVPTIIINISTIIIFLNPYFFVKKFVIGKNTADVANNIADTTVTKLASLFNIRLT